MYRWITFPLASSGNLLGSTIWRSGHPLSVSGTKRTGLKRRHLQALLYDLLMGLVRASAAALRDKDGSEGRAGKDGGHPGSRWMAGERRDRTAWKGRGDEGGRIFHYVSHTCTTYGILLYFPGPFHGFLCLQSAANVFGDDNKRRICHCVLFQQP